MWLASTATDTPPSFPGPVTNSPHSSPWIGSLDLSGTANAQSAITADGDVIEHLPSFSAAFGDCFVTLISASDGVARAEGGHENGAADRR
jgi:hypothetical protein